MNKTKSPITIDAVQSSTELMPSTSESNGLSMLKQFTPLGHIADMYARTLAYKLETKRLDAELKRIETQAALAHHAIDKTVELKMEELLQKRIALMGFFKTVNAELKSLRIERKTVLQMAQLAEKYSFSPGISLEQQRLATDMAMELVKQTFHFDQQANLTIQQLVQALPAVEMPSQLLN